MIRQPDGQWILAPDEYFVRISHEPQINTQEAWNRACDAAIEAVMHPRATKSRPWRDILAEFMALADCSCAAFLVHRSCKHVFHRLTVPLSPAMPKVWHEEHWCDVGQLSKFLDGYYANVRPGDTVMVWGPGDAFPEN